MDYSQVNKAVALDLVSVKVAAPFVAPMHVATPGDGSQPGWGTQPEGFGGHGDDGGYGGFGWALPGSTPPQRPIQ